jgi:hypothetical protein
MADFTVLSLLVERGKNQSVKYKTQISLKMKLLKVEY